MKQKTIIFLWAFLLALGYLGVVECNVGASEEEGEITEEDLEIIENLEILDNLDLFEEDLSFLEDYTDID